MFFSVCCYVVASVLPDDCQDVAILYMWLTRCSEWMSGHCYVVVKVFFVVVRVLLHDC